jgi:hypothetical protein
MNHRASIEKRRFVDKETLFSLDVPDGWLIDTSGQRGSKVLLLDPQSEDKFRANVNVVVQNLDPLTAEEFLTLSRLQLKQLSGRSELDLDAPAEQPRGGRVFEYTVQRPQIAPIPLKVRQVIYVDKEQAYIVTGTATLARFEFHCKDIESVLESFQVASGGRS